MSHRFGVVAVSIVCFSLGLIWAASPAHAQIRDEYARETSHSFPIGAEGSIRAATPDGHITVDAWDGDDVALVVRKRVRTWKGAAQAEAYFSKLKVDIVQEGDSIDIRGDGPDFRLGIAFGYSIDYELKVPAGVNMELRTSDGEVRVEGVLGQVYAKTSAGNITVMNVGAAELKTSNGAVRVEAVEGELSARTSDGDIRVSNVLGDAYVKSSNGNVDCREVAGLLVVQLSDGDAHVSEIQGGISAKSSNGHLVVRDAAGPVELRTSNGDIDLSLTRPVPMSRVTCKSSDGNIRFKLSEAAAFTVEARTSAGRVNVGVPGKFHRENEGKRIEGHVNGGGPAVNLRTSDGSITIEPA